MAQIEEVNLNQLNIKALTWAFNVIASRILKIETSRGLKDNDYRLALIEHHSPGYRKKYSGLINREKRDIFDRLTGCTENGRCYELTVDKFMELKIEKTGLSKLLDAAKALQHNLREPVIISRIELEKELDYLKVVFGRPEKPTLTYASRRSIR